MLRLLAALAAASSAPGEGAFGPVDESSVAAWTADPRWKTA